MYLFVWHVSYVCMCVGWWNWCDIHIFEVCVFLSLCNVSLCYVCMCVMCLCIYCVYDVMCVVCHMHTLWCACLSMCLCVVLYICHVVCNVWYVCLVYHVCSMCIWQVLFMCLCVPHIHILIFQRWVGPLVLLSLNSGELMSALLQLCI